MVRRLDRFLAGFAAQRIGGVIRCFVEGWWRVCKNRQQQGELSLKRI